MALYNSIREIACSVYNTEAHRFGITLTKIIYENYFHVAVEGQLVCRCACSPMVLCSHVLCN